LENQAIWNSSKGIYLLFQKVFYLLLIPELLLSALNYFYFKTNRCNIYYKMIMVVATNAVLLLNVGLPAELATPIQTPLSPE
jgi:hypothetical protein